jgi:hypothetical protein
MNHVWLHTPEQVMECDERIQSLERMPQALLEIRQLHSMGEEKALIFAARARVDDLMTKVGLPAGKIDGDMCISMAVLAMI